MLDLPLGSVVETLGPVISKPRGFCGSALPSILSFEPPGASRSRLGLRLLNGRTLAGEPATSGPLDVFDGAGMLFDAGCGWEFTDGPFGAVGDFLTSATAGTSCFP